MSTKPVSAAGAEALTFTDGRASVRVRDLIAASTFEASAGFHALAPEVTVVLPTFRRGDSGMLRACIESVLAQSFTDLELIVIDDGSTDSTRGIIEHFLAVDPRVATIRHPKNIGLPGLSCNEAIIRGRASKVFFTFDDNTLNLDGLETMMAAATAAPDRHFVYAEVFAPYPGHDRTEGTGVFSLARLHEQNFIPNGAVLLDRAVFDRCGLYDPHILITRRCDWDLWLRVTREFAPFHVETVIATENGRTQADSLGNSYAWDQALAEEWIATDRVARLRPDAILDYDVAASPDDLTELSRAKIRAYAERFFGAPAREDVAPPGYLLLICDAVSADLRETFVHNPGEARVVPITYFQAEVLGLWDLMLAARRVIFADGIDKAEPLATRLRLVEKGYDYYVGGDDQVLPTAPQRQRDEFIAGAGRLLRRDDRDSHRPLAWIESTAAQDPWPAMTGPWQTTSLGELYAGATAPDMLAYAALANGLIRLAQLEPVAVPDGYYTGAEFAARMRQRLRSRPLSVFRLLGSAVKALRTRRT